MRRWLAGLLALCAAPGLAAERVVSLAPFLTDIILQLEAGDRLVGVLDDGHLPARLDSLPRVGGHQTLSLERIAALQPDLVLAWTSGTPEELLSRLEQWGVAVMRFDPKRLTDIAPVVAQLGRELNASDRAAALNTDFSAGLRALARGPANDTPRIFIQLWDDPLYTVTSKHLISDAVQHCGGENIFDNLPGLAPQIGREGVLAADPDLIVVLADERKPASEWLRRWRRFPQLSAVQHNALYLLDSDSLVRPTPAVLEGVEKLCALIEASQTQPGATKRLK